PALVLLAPSRARGQPNRERFGEVFVGMLLRVPAGDVPHESPGERHRPVVVAIRAPERSEESSPFGRLEELVGVVERVPGLVARVHQDLALVFEIVHLFFQPRELWVGEVERNPDDRLSRRASPFVGQVAERTKESEPLALELAVYLLNEPLDRRAFEL